MYENLATDEKIEQYLSANDFSALENYCEQNIKSKSNEIADFWYLGIAYLLQGKEEEAQVIWLTGLAKDELDNIETLSKSLVHTLDLEARRQSKLQNTEQEWLIRQHIRSIDPSQSKNLLYLLNASIDTQSFEPELLEEWELLEHFQNDPCSDESTLVLRCLEKILEYPHPLTLDFVELCMAHHTDTSAIVEAVMTAAIKANQQYLIPKYSSDLAEICLAYSPKNFSILNQLPRFYMRSKDYRKAILSAEKLYKVCDTDQKKIFGCTLLLKALLSAGNWPEINKISDEYKSLVSTLIERQSENLPLSLVQFLIGNTALFLYLDDDINTNRWFQNHVSSLFQKNLRRIIPFNTNIRKRPSNIDESPIKIGYIAHTLTTHSVGWLSRWIFQHHQQEKFEINLYLINQQEKDEFTDTWFKSKVSRVHHCKNDIAAVAKQIKNDNVDILVDLDSVTLDFTCSVMALKPAPIQVTWLGWDASGLPSIDYYLADEKVIPPEFSSHYREKIWYLPQTYIAVDGFEVGIPSISRETLNIDDTDAVIYFTAQTGFKRHPETAKAQIDILSRVPNSYLLIKGLSDQETVQKLFSNLARDAGVDSNRLRFLPLVESESVHRANLKIADVVLDTFPYNGATTTLETLWMEVPIVTQVGKQLSARNSHAFMKNAGVEEGIALCREDYIEWGVKLGTDKELRQKVILKLREAKQTSSLWNAKLFTQNLEAAYFQMWNSYVTNS